MINATALTKRYGDKVAVNDLTFTVRPGIVTGFLGPNGAGKSTTMRMIVGLDRPSSGAVTVNGRPYAQHAAPLREVGTLLEAKAVHTSRSARDHLLALADTHGIGKQRVSDVIELVGLEEVAGKRAGGFSLGMGQRLGIASALLGDPATVMLDEPVNGLDPEGVRWVRDLLRNLAQEGRTVFVSSHLMSEMAVTAEHLIVIGRGTLLADMSLADFISANSTASVRVRSPNAHEFAGLLAGPHVTVTSTEAEMLDITGLTAAEVGDLALRQQIPLHELRTVQASLEEAFMAMTEDSVEYHATLDHHGKAAA
ncbi:MAG: ATP-binding cassette domain-containing protein [Actinomycetota bacterium]|nr:ATP-binding cassette domain-containing protein [Actinomycetota bacterium]